MYYQENYPDNAGCVDVHGRTENGGKLVIENTLCLCNTTLCNETDDQSGALNLAPKFVSLILTFALTFLIFN